VAKKAVKSAAKKTAGKAAPRLNEVSFGSTRTELKNLREKLHAILDKDGENLTIQDIIQKIDALDRLLICQTVMTRAF
jgi:hypothetical protein